MNIFKGKFKMGSQKLLTRLEESVLVKPQVKVRVTSDVGGIKSEKNAGEDSAINLLAGLIEQACEKRASDIHIDPQRENINIRFRVDGVLQDVLVLPKIRLGEFISRIKILSSLRTDEHQSTQDGRFRYELKSGRAVDVRVAIAPAYYGENAVLRLLSDKAEDFNLQLLGFSPENEEKIINAIKKPYGMILATGPTGSGKTTTLYTLVKMLNKRESAIITIEDPIEYSIEGINQIQTNTRTGLSFGSGLRSVLRQDPDIIMVGEIRDAETAAISVNSALTGHLLLSSLHTNDAATTLPRLLDLKIESYLIAATVNLVIGQRLLRKICGHCKTEHILTLAEQKSLKNSVASQFLQKNSRFFKGAGCGKCGNTGYFGRIGIHEVLEVNTVIREAILNKVTSEEIKNLAISRGMTPLVADGISKAALGLTTIEEVLRILYE